MQYRKRVGTKGIQKRIQIALEKHKVFEKTQYAQIYHHRNNQRQNSGSSGKLSFSHKQSAEIIDHGDKQAQSRKPRVQPCVKTIAGTEQKQIPPPWQKVIKQQYNGQKVKYEYM